MNRSYIIISHIRDETSFLVKCMDGLSFDNFLNNLILQKAILHSLMVIGEAATQLKKEEKNFSDNHPEIDWKGMSGLRNRLIHEYFAINYELVWHTLVHDIPILNQKISKLCDIYKDSED